MATTSGEGERLQPAGRAEWRAWLAANHDASDGIWLVLWRRGSGRTGLTYEEAVLEALCFGWIDGQAAGLDDRRTMLRFSPRKRGSGWARSNKLRVERLLAEGLMAPPGLAKIEEAKRDGSWTRLDAVEDLVVPDDLAAALDAEPAARTTFDGLSYSNRSWHVLQVTGAKTEETRQRRIDKSVAALKQGRAR